MDQPETDQPGDAAGDTRFPWEKVADDLRDKITSGALPPGWRLPGENPLGERYRVARSTARHAIRHLVETGYLEVVPKSGTFVRKIKSAELQMSIDGRAVDPWQHSAAATDEVRDEIIRASTVPIETVTILGTPLRELLDTAAGRVICRTRVRVVDGVPQESATSYYAMEIAKGTDLVHADRDADVFAILGERGYTVEGARHPADRLVPRNATREDLELLMPEGMGLRRPPAATPMAEVLRRVFVTPGDRCLVVRHSIFVCDGTEFVYG